MNKHFNEETIEVEETTNEGDNTPKLKLRRYLVHFLFIVVIVASGAAYYFYNEASGLKDDPNKTAREETDKLVAQVGKLIVLPEGEVPTVATVSDPEKLKDQPFFARAKTGHKVLIYTNARKALLYDPENNKIVEVAPINIGDSKTQ